LAKGGNLFGDPAVTGFDCKMQSKNIKHCGLHDLERLTPSFYKINSMVSSGSQEKSGIGMRQARQKSAIMKIIQLPIVSTAPAGCRVLDWTGKDGSPCRPLSKSGPAKY